MSEDHGHRFAVYSPTGVHIGLWQDGKIASQVQSERPGNTIEELVKLDHALALVAEAYEVAAVIASDNVPATVKAAAIRAMTPTDARAALDAMLAKAREEGERAGLRKAGAICNQSYGGSIGDAHKAIIDAIYRTAEGDE